MATATEGEVQEDVGEALFRVSEKSDWLRRYEGCSMEWALANTPLGNEKMGDGLGRLFSSLIDLREWVDDIEDDNLVYPKEVLAESVADLAMLLDRLCVVQVVGANSSTDN